MKISGGFKNSQGRVFGVGRLIKKFRVELKDGRTEIVEIRFLGKWLRPKVEAWWRAEIKSYQPIGGNR